MNSNQLAGRMSIALALLFIISFSMLALTVVAQSPAPSAGGKTDKPVTPPKEPPQSRPACPSDFEDKDCLHLVIGEHPNDVSQAEGLAHLNCSIQYHECINQEQIEYGKAKDACEAVEGCKLTAFSTPNGCDKADCDGSGPLGDLGPFSCSIEVGYDIGDYECKRPGEDEPSEK